MAMALALPFPPAPPPGTHPHDDDSTEYSGLRTEPGCSTKCASLQGMNEHRLDAHVPAVAAVTPPIGPSPLCHPAGAAPPTSSSQLVGARHSTASATAVTTQLDPEHKPPHMQEQTKFSSHVPLNDGTVFSTRADGTHDWALLYPTVNDFERCVQKDAVKAVICGCLEEQGVGIRESSGKGPRVMNFVCSQTKKPAKKSFDVLAGDAEAAKKRSVLTSSKRTADCKFLLKVKWFGDDNGHDYRKANAAGRGKRNSRTAQVRQSGWWVSGNMCHSGHARLTATALGRSNSHRSRKGGKALHPPPMKAEAAAALPGPTTAMFTAQPPGTATPMPMSTPGCPHGGLQKKLWLIESRAEEERIVAEAERTFARVR